MKLARPIIGAQVLSFGSLMSKPELQISFLVSHGCNTYFQGNNSIWFSFTHSCTMDFPAGSDSKASAYDAGDPGLITELGRYPGEGNGNPL